MRGTAPLRGIMAMARRFIPAHAGNRPRPARTPRVIAVHPRACGEQRLVALGRHPHRGSSPRMRGTGLVDRPVQALRRFIPAHAGNRPGRRCPERPCSVHPRACGEQLEHVRGASALRGSSPRMRGTGQAGCRSRYQGRFIPAHAGNRNRHGSAVERGPVHPRACGEQLQRLLAMMGVTGSSPRMRGTVWLEDIGLSAFLPCQRAYRS